MVRFLHETETVTFQACCCWDVPAPDATHLSLPIRLLANGKVNSTCNG